MLEVGTKVILGIRGYHEQEGKIVDSSTYAYTVETEEDVYTIPTNELGVKFYILQKYYEEKRFDVNGKPRKNGKLIKTETKYKEVYNNN